MTIPTRARAVNWNCSSRMPEFLASPDRISPEDSGSLLSFVGAQHRTMGRFTAARHSFSRALASAEKSFEPGHPSIAIDQSNLALVLKDLGQLEEARDLLCKALASDEKSFEPVSYHAIWFWHAFGASEPSPAELS